MFSFDDKILLKSSKNDILTVGELLIDMISENYDEHLSSSTYKRFFGGSPANIAINTKRFGINSIVTSAVGKDSLGDYLVNCLREAGMETDYIQQVDYATSMVFVTKSKTTPIPIFYRDADYHLKYNSMLENALLDSKIIHFSCWPISRIPVRDTIEKVISVAKKEGILVCFDPNYHPMIWLKGEDGVAYIKSVIGSADIVKPSEVDAERIFGKDTDENQVAKFLELGAKLVIMTLGKNGAIVSNGVETQKFDTLPTEVVDVTGAGDAFWSGFYAAIVKGFTIKDALKLGFAVSDYKIRYLGAIVDLPRLEKIKEMYNL